MKYKLIHKSAYDYSAAVSDSVMEMRVHPVNSQTQKLCERKCEVDPVSPLFQFEDFFGNTVEYFSIAYPHQQLSIINEAIVETYTQEISSEFFKIPYGDFLQIIRNRSHRLYYFQNFSALTPEVGGGLSYAKSKIKANQEIGQIIDELNNWIYEDFTYCPGATTVDTPLEEFAQNGKGVCQDFTHLMLSILRTYKIPCRYVSGYIEGVEAGVENSNLIGAMASHAWVEVFLGENQWVGYDPTNNCRSGEQHIKVAHGRDYLDVSPVRGTFRGSSHQNLSVTVELNRVS